MAVLVVNGEIDTADAVQEKLEEQGHGCLLARDVDEAEMILRAAPIDVLVLDMCLVGRHPLAWLEELCLERPELTSCSVVVTERDLDATEVVRLQACGARLLRQPFRIDELHAAVLDGLERARRQGRGAVGRRPGDRPGPPRPRNPEDLRH